PLATPGSVPFTPEDVISNDGKEFWLLSTLNVGNTAESGIQFVGSVGASTATEIGPAGDDGQAIGIAGGQLYVSHNSDVHSVGTGLPTTAGQTLGSLPNFQTAYNSGILQFAPNAKSFLFLNTTDGTSNNPDVAYVADQSNGIVKFWKDGSGNWQIGRLSDNAFAQKLIFSGGATDVVGSVNLTTHQIQLYVTGSNVQGQNANQIASFLDTNGA